MPISTPMLTIEEDYSSREAVEWLELMVEDLLECLNLDACVGAVNGDKIRDEISAQVSGLSYEETDGLVKDAVRRLIGKKKGKM